MKCIDAVEGILKCILLQLTKRSIEYRLDDSEHICIIKSVIDAAEGYLKNNPEIAEDPNLLKQVLYEYARTIWLQTLSAEDHAVACGQDVSEQNHEYETYYFDYLYNRGIFPQ